MGHIDTVGHRKDFASNGPGLVPVYRPHLIFNIVNGNSFFLGQASYLKIFWALREKFKVLPESLGLGGSQFKIIQVQEWHILGWPALSPIYANNEATSNKTSPTRMIFLLWDYPWSRWKIITKKLWKTLRPRYFQDFSGETCALFRPYLSELSESIGFALFMVFWVILQP